MSHVTQFLTLLVEKIRTALLRVASLFLRLVKIRAVLSRAVLFLFILIKKIRAALSRASSFLILLLVKTRSSALSSATSFLIFLLYILTVFSTNRFL